MSNLSPHDPSAASSAAKAGVAWVGVMFGKAGISTWSDLAAVLAALYSALLIAGWVWDRLVRRRARRKAKEQ